MTETLTAGGSFFGKGQPSSVDRFSTRQWSGKCYKLPEEGSGRTYTRLNVLLHSIYYRMPLHWQLKSSLSLRFRIRPIITKHMITADAGDLCISPCTCALSRHTHCVDVITHVTSATDVTSLTEPWLSTYELTDVSPVNTRYLRYPR